MEEQLTRFACKMSMAAVADAATSYSDRIWTTSFTYTDFDSVIPGGPARWLLFEDDAPSEKCSSVTVCCSLLEYLAGNIPDTADVIGIHASDFLDMTEDGTSAGKAPRACDFLFDETGLVDARTPYLPEHFVLDAPDGEVETSYIGDIPDYIIDYYAKGELMQAVNSEAYLKALGAYERFDLPDPAMDPLPILSCGRESLPWKVSYGNSSGEPFQVYNALEWELNEDKLDALMAKTPYGEFTAKVRDLSRIWSVYQDRALEGLRIPSQSDVKRGEYTVDDLSATAGRLAVRLGIDKAVEAYYGGVPVSDIVK